MAIPTPPPPQNADASPNPNPSWFTPKRLLAMFCVINMLNYIDRGAIASNGVNGSIGTCTESGVCTSGTGIQGDFELSNFEDGVLSSAFMVGLLVASPIFASLAKSHNPFRLIGVGLSVWTFATAGCGCAFDFWSITICRMLVGVGEASFISLAAPFIDDNAPVAQKTAWLAIFYMCIPTGIAIGYVYGGLVGIQLHWRAAFWGESFFMLPFAILGFLVKPLQLKGFSSESKNRKAYDEMTVPEIQDEHISKREVLANTEDLTDPASKKMSLSTCDNSFHIQLGRFWKDTRELMLEKVYIVNVLGYIAYNFVIGAYSYWGPKAGSAIYHMADADLMFGGITIVCGIFGTLAGGYALDRMQATIPNAFKAPVNYICLHTVKPSSRPLAMAISTVSIHIFGDVPSSPLVGVLQDYVQNWRVTALVLTSVLFVAAIVWFSGIFLHSVDRYYEDSEHERPICKPLLDGSTEELA